MSAIAFVVADSESPDATYETPFYDRMTSTLGHSVTYISDEDAESTDFSSYDAIVISQSTIYYNVDGLKSEATPILVFNHGSYFGLCSSQTTKFEDTWYIVDNSHYITQDRSVENVAVFSSGRWHWYASTWSNDVDDLAYMEGESSQATILVCESGDTLSDSSEAAERRVFLGTRGNGTINAVGWEIFDYAIGWILYEDAAATYTKTYTLDALLKKLDITKTYTADVLLLKELTKTYTLDALLKKADITKTYTLDTILTTLNTKTYTLDVILLATLTKTYTLDVILYSAFDPVSIIQNVLDANWNGDNVSKPSIRSMVAVQPETGQIKRWNHLTQGDLIRIYEVGFEKVPMSAGYDYATTKIKIKADITTAQGRSHLFDVFDEARSVLHSNRGAPDSTHTSWRPLIITGRKLHYDKYKKLWRLELDIELLQKCYALA